MGASDEDIRQKISAGNSNRQIAAALHCDTKRVSRIRKQMQAETTAAPPEEDDEQDILLTHIRAIEDSAYQTLRQAQTAGDVTDPKWMQAYSSLVCAALRAVAMRRELIPDRPQEVIELVVGDLPREGDGWRLVSESQDYDPDATLPASSPATLPAPE